MSEDTMNPGWVTRVRFLAHGGCIVERESCELTAFSITLPTEDPLNLHIDGTELPPTAPKTGGVRWYRTGFGSLK